MQVEVLVRGSQGQADCAIQQMLPWVRIAQEGLLGGLRCPGAKMQAHGPG